MLQHTIKHKPSELEPLAAPGKTSGFVSPAEDYMEGRLNILERIIKDPVNTYYAEADSNELIEFGISKGTLFVYDTSIIPKHGCLVVAHHEGEWKVRQLLIDGNKQFLSKGNNEDPEEVTQSDLLIRGVVTWSCRPHEYKPKRHVRSR